MKTITIKINEDRESHLFTASIIVDAFTIRRAIGAWSGVKQSIIETVEKILDDQQARKP
jgi:hypothetical protein